MSLEQKQRLVIGDALARALYDCPLHVLRVLNSDGYDHSSAMEVARRMVRELDHAGWQVKGDRREVMRLEDAICMALSTSNCQKLCSQSPEWARAARVKTTQNICNVLGWKSIVLFHRTRSS